MEWWKIGILVLVFVLLGWGMYNLVTAKTPLKKEIQTLQTPVNSLAEENKNLTALIEYFKRPENLLKEVKSQFNYHEVGEKLIIIVPGASTTLGTSTSR